MKKRRKRELLSKRPKELFLGIGVSFTTAVFMVGFCILVIWGAFLVRQLLEREFWERAARAVGETAQSLGADGSDGSGGPYPSGAYGPLVFASFSDLFSGAGWIDTARTTMRLDLSASAFTFPPKVSWERVGGGADAGLPAPAGGGPRCIAARCLEVRGAQVFLDGEVMSLPASLAGATVVSVSVEALSTKWALGYVTEVGGAYRGAVFTFNGARFTPVFMGERALTSPHLGTFGFGGDDGDWLMVYGAYEGVAYHVREGKAPRDVSPFFHARLMNGGFAPQVLRSGSGADTTWYVWSACPPTGGRPCVPRLLKLFQNGTDEIQGIVDLGGTFPARGVTALSLRPAAAGAPRELLAALSLNGAPEEWRFTDGGFEVSGRREVVSKNLNTYRAEVHQLVQLNVGTSSLAGSDAQFFVSNDGASWEAVAFGEALAFPNPSGTLLFWRAVFEGAGDPALSPFLERVNVDYRVRYIR